MQNFLGGLNFFKPVWFSFPFVSHYGLTILRNVFLQRCSVQKVLHACENQLPSFGKNNETLKNQNHSDLKPLGVVAQPQMLTELWNHSKKSSGLHVCYFQPMALVWRSMFASLAQISFFKLMLSPDTHFSENCRIAGPFLTPIFSSLHINRFWGV